MSLCVHHWTGKTTIETFTKFIMGKFYWTMWTHDYLSILN